MRAPAAMALFKTKGKRPGRRHQKALVCTPKLGYRTSLTAVLRESPAGLRRARFQRYGAASTVGGFRHGPTRARAMCFPVQKKDTV